MEIIKIAVLGIVAVLIAVQLKGTKTEYGFIIAFAAAIFIFVLSIQKVSVVVSQMGAFKSVFGEQSTYFEMLLKVIGMTYLCEFSSSICKDAGFSALAGQIQIFGKMYILLSGMPIVITLIETMQNF